MEARQSFKSWRLGHIPERARATIPQIQDGIFRHSLHEGVWVIGMEELVIRDEEAPKLSPRLPRPDAR
jgi:hypothetical protein